MYKYTEKSIADAMKSIDSKKWVLPTIQRKFTWDKERICNLFDSLMCDYPIGSLMIWKITKKQLFNQLQFFEFIRDYQEKFKEKNSNYKANITVNPELYAVIDGQQRLNSFYIALLGSYATLLPRKHFKSEYDESVQPKEYLYLNLTRRLNKLEAGKEFDFKFLSNQKLKDMDDRNNWFKVGEILDLDDFTALETEEDAFEGCIWSIIENQKIADEYKHIAFKNLTRLYKVIKINTVIRYFEEDTQDLDKVIDIFIRANSGGVTLSFSDLVMSVMVGRWKDAGDKIDELVKLIFTVYGFDIDRDFIIKCFLIIYSNDIKFRVANFTDEFVNKISDNFDVVAEYIKKSCNFVKQSGITDQILRAKYALLPIIYYVNKFELDIDNMSKYKENKNNILLWLKMALLKGMFGGQPDSILPKIREVINLNAKKDYFPLKEIVTEFENKNKDIRITKDFIIDKVDSVKYGSAEATLILSLITDMDPQHIYHVDHMYPKSMFLKSKIESYKFLDNNETLKKFYSNKNNWNTIGNLQLLNSTENVSKLDSELKEWLDKNPNYNKDLYFIPKDATGNYIVEKDKFEQFVNGRKELIRKKLYSIFGISED